MNGPNSGQLTLEFQASIVERHSTCLACVRQAAHTHRNPLKTIAADMDLSESELSRKLAQNEGDTRRFTLDDLERFVQATGDTTPIMYLVAKYLADKQALKNAALQELVTKLPDLMALIQQATRPEA